MKYCCFRFDADTHACVSRGIPRLVALADELGVKFTFFVNMGRAFDARISLAKAIWRMASRAPRKSIPASSKLGWRESIRAAIFNPRAGKSDPAALRTAEIAGHEIGLHGGRNHAQWEKSAHLWTEEQLREEVRTGIRWMVECGLKHPISFSSPAWNSPRFLESILPTLGFQILADILDEEQCSVSQRGVGLVHIPTNIVAAPGSAGYLESMRLRGWDQSQIVRDFSAQLARKSSLAVVYDHPFFAGMHALGTLRELVKVAVDQGCIIGTIRAAVEGLRGASGVSPLLRMAS